MLVGIAGVLYAGLLFFMSSRPLAAFAGSNVSWLHIPAYMVLGFLLCVALDEPRLGFATSVFIGIAEELYQGTVPGRTMSLLDVLLDSLGALLGVLLGLLFVRWLVPRLCRLNCLRMLGLVPLVNPKLDCNSEHHSPKDNEHI
jgi:hypothetical protein